MKSTDHNLNNPMKVDTLNLYPSIDSSKLSDVVKLTADEYELIKIKDPTCIYIITNSSEKKVYYGDMLVEQGSKERIYLLGPSNKFGEYTLYLNEIDGGNDRLIKICRYDNPQTAMDALNMFNKVGSHMSANLQVYNVVCGYIKRDISLHDMIIGIICVFGYRDNIQLQNLLSVITRYAGNPQSLDLHLILKRDLPDLRRHYSNNPLFGFYSDLYDLVVSYKFFKDQKFQKDPDSADLSEVVEKVFNIMTNK